MKTLTREDLESLIKAENGVCVSLYLNTARAGQETLENPLRLRHQLREAEDQLAVRGTKRSDIAQLLKPARDLEDDYPFWQKQDHGLGIFLCRDCFRAWRIPYKIAPLTVVGLSFHLKPLLPLLANDRSFFILSLSRNAVMLYRATRYTIERVLLPNVPQSEAEALKYDDPEKSLQLHTSRAAEPGMVHGQGAAKEGTKDRTLRFFRRVNAGLHDHLKNEHAPLLVAGVEYYLPLYRQANTYPHFYEDMVTGNPEHMSPDQLRKAAWEKVEPLLRRDQEHSAAAIASGLSHAHATERLEEAVVACFQGRVDKCFVALNEQRWGAVDEGRASVQLLERNDPRACDLIDFAAVQSLLHGGCTFPVATVEDMPAREPLAVLFRY